MWSNGARPTARAEPRRRSSCPQGLVDRSPPSAALCSGIGRYLAVLSPPQIRASGFHRTRLPGQSSYPVYLQDRVAPRWVCLQPQGPYLTSATVLLCSPASPPDPLPHVSTLAGRVSPLTRPYVPGYGFPSPFGWHPSLLGASCPPGALFLPCGWPTGLSEPSPISRPDPRRVSTFRTVEMRLG